ncbi:SGNH/GDSL hydrolase family protein [Tessaracoccus oleiagri]|uniref:SGNH/GDSL hydrolase family protein n=1 Tax=Tessaracoccus oleiagri TaxID=686624 RepID=UPI00159FD7F4|nr:SGNH/GDSL hydrolase family protein [Tessaracoccus oleiagri]
MIGDSFSLGEEAWVSTAAEELGWGDVVNLASPGRGYLSAPRSCDFEPCSRFGGSVDLIAQAQPELVVTFGGTADGDYALDDAPSDYFAALREALPDAELVAINPVTGDSPAPYWLTLHAKNIRAAVEAVDGTFINVGQPGAGDGDTLTAETQDEIARAVVEALS